MYIYTVNWTPRTTQNAHSGAVYSLAWDEQEQIVFSGGADKVVASWNVELTEQKKLTIRTSAPIYSLLVVPLSRRLFIGLSDGNLHVIDLDKRTEIASSHPHQGGIYDLAYDAKHDWVWSAGGDGWLHIWNATTAEKLRSIPFSQEKIRQIRFGSLIPNLPIFLIPIRAMKREVQRCVGTPISRSCSVEGRMVISELGYPERLSPFWNSQRIGTLSIK
jgi:WD40 repeat protein